MDRLPDSGYLRAKVAQEKIIRESGIPYTIVRSTQFMEFLDGITQAPVIDGTARLSTGGVNVAKIHSNSALAWEIRKPTWWCNNKAASISPHPAAYFPPETSRNVPVMKEASALASHRIARATSSG